MKSRKIQLVSLFAIILGVVAWAPPTNEDIIMGGGNTVTSPNGYVGVIGGSNTVNARSTLVVGDSNTAQSDTSQSVIVGSGNFFKGGRARSIISGNSNTVTAQNSIVVGTQNTVAGPSLADTANYESAAFGNNNQIYATRGWAMGMTNNVYGNQGVAIGSDNQAWALQSAAFGSGNIIDAQSQYSYALGGGLRVTQPGSVAIGAWNAPMVAGDVMVVGCGNPTTPATALRVTSDGGVILGRAQGDISMGIYQ